MYNYQKNNVYFAQLADDIKEQGAEELSELGAEKIIPAYRGISFSAGKKVLYQINYTARLVSRVLAPLVNFTCSTGDELYKRAKQITWTDFMTKENTFAVFSNVSHSKITHSQYASLRLKDGIVDSFRERSGTRPDIDTRNPDVWFNLYINSDRAIISLDTSGGALHRRGYRRDAVSAPMQETVAAAIIRYTEWNGSVPLHDPMCGSGTLLGEALMSYCNIPSGFFRERFGFERLPDYDISLWASVRKEHDRNIRDLPAGHISGSDLSGEAVKIAKTNIQKLPQGNKVHITLKDFRQARGLENGVIITNPPYGIRTGEPGELEMLYTSLGDFLKQKCKGSAAYIYFGNRDFIKKTGLRPAWKKPLKSGGLDGRLVKYEMY
jgi:putative N6-adenine-specific DNA methylase